MTKTDIVKELSRADMPTVKLTQDQAKEILDQTLTIIADGLNADGVVQITGFGTFKSTFIPASVGHNPRNPEEKIDIAPRYQVSFSSGTKLKEEINKKLAK